MAFQGDSDAWFVIGACVVMIAVTPLMGLLIQRTMCWQVSAIGLRYVNVVIETTLTWDEIEYVRQCRPFPLYSVGAAKRLFMNKQIVLAPCLMECFSEFQMLIAKYAPAHHVLVDFGSRGR